MFKKKVYLSTKKLLISIPKYFNCKYFYILLFSNLTISIHAVLQNNILRLIIIIYFRFTYLTSAYIYLQILPKCIMFYKQNIRK